MHGPEDIIDDESDEGWQEALSPDSLVEQIDKEGASFGLCAEYDPDMQRVFVCELEPKTEVHYGMGDCSREAAGRRLASVDDAHPLSAVFGNRILPGEEKPGERFKRHDAVKAQQKKEQMDGSRHEARSVMGRKLRGGAIFYPTMLADTAAYRKAKEIRDELRKLGRGR